MLAGWRHVLFTVSILLVLKYHNSNSCGVVPTENILSLQHRLLFIFSEILKLRGRMVCIDNELVGKREAN